PSSIFASVVDVKIIEPPRRAVTLEPPRIGGDLGAGEKAGDAFDVGRRHLLLHAVGTEAGDIAGDKDVGLVNRVPEIVAGVAAHDEGTRLAHKAAHMADRTADHDGDAFHRNAAARAGVALNDDEAAAPRCG